ncbi:galactose-1-phosphate uridylyltransferase [Candidatus Woesearchaeota archaeon]|nr:galactose-1-phosphate uridylyltransferase [Candidatus Woesearchaeota archaeon]
MAELRKDYILDRYVIIATERSLRPHQFKRQEESKKVDVCYFCPGKEDLTPPETGRVQIETKGMKGWCIRYFPNKYPAVMQEGNSIIKTDNEFFTYADAVGMHEVIVETPEHEKELADLSVQHIARVLEVYKERIEMLSKLPDIKYVAVFKNSGREAGTSLVHSHSQIIAYNLIPPIITEKEQACRKSNSCPYCKMLNIEKNSYRRCYENEHFLSFTPYASRFPMEVWMLPKRHVLSIAELSGPEMTALAEMLKRILLKLKDLNAPYNYYLQYGLEKMHFHIEILPRLSTLAGFEFSTGTIINTLTPEEAAGFYRNEKVG